MIIISTRLYVEVVKHYIHRVKSIKSLPRGFLEHTSTIEGKATAVAIKGWRIPSIIL